MTDIFTLSDHFSKYFNIYLADTPELKKEVFRIRYKVYCEELGYEPLDKFPDKLEKDIYDNRSIHCILQHKPTGIYAGCVRLILSNQDSPNDQFPFEYICPNHSLDFNTMPREHFGEVSRLAVLSRFRKRLGEENTPEGLIVFDQKKEDKQLEDKAKQKRRSPVIALSLYLAATVVVVDLELEYALTLMEPRLARHLRMMGLNFSPIGKAIDFHGKRGPFSIKIPGLVNNLRKNSEVYGLFQTIYNSVGNKSSHNQEYDERIS